MMDPVLCLCETKKEHVIRRQRVTDCDVTGEKKEISMGRVRLGRRRRRREGEGRTYLIFHRTSHSHLLDRSLGLDHWQQVGVS